MSWMGTALMGAALYPLTLLLLRGGSRSGGRGRGGGARGLIGAADHRVGDVDGVGGVNEARLELVEDRRQTHLLAEGVDDRLDLRLELGQGTVASLADVAVGVLREALHGDLLVGQA